LCNNRFLCPKQAPDNNAVRFGFEAVEGDWSETAFDGTRPGMPP
jgi:hypothetical protein